MKKALFTTSDFVRPANDPEKGGYILQVIPVLENGQHYDYRFLDYRSGEICRHHEDEIMKFDKPADFDNPQQRRRVKPLAIGDTVFDCEVHLFAEIVNIDKFGFVHLDQSKTLELNKRHFDYDAELYNATWVVSDTDCLYQLVPGRVDHREGLPICYEHNTTMDNYPYYSPFLDENLFYIETKQENSTEDVPDEGITLLHEDPAFILKDSAAVARYLKDSVLKTYQENGNNPNILLFLDEKRHPLTLVSFKEKVPSAGIITIPKEPEDKDLFTVLAARVTGTSPLPTASQMRLLGTEADDAIHEALKPLGADINEKLLLGDDRFYSFALGAEKNYPIEEKKETTESTDEDHIVNAPAGEEETIEVMLTEERFPKAFNNKLRELMDQKAFDSEDEARAWIRSTPFVLELYYEKDSGLFAVESEALDSCPETICSPYTKTPFKDNED